jgi:hypothetical protein
MISVTGIIGIRTIRGNCPYRAGGNVAVTADAGKDFLGFI